MTAGAIQFRGADEVIAAYELNDCPAWALFCGKNILGQYKGESIDEGTQLLMQWCDQLRKGMSGATYQLRMYEGPVRSINNTMPFNYSFQFKLITAEEADEEGYGRSATNKQLLDRIAKLEAEREEEPEEIGGVQGFIGKILNNPEMQNFLMQTVGTIVGGFVRKVTGQGAQAATMAGAPGQQPMAPEAMVVDLGPVIAAMPEDQRAFLDQALQILLTRDPKAGERLYGIAKICRDNPGQYDMLAGMLK